MRAKPIPPHICEVDRIDPVLLYVALPVGISFYTFHAISYAVDVYRGDVAASRSYLDYLNFVMFFPQLVAGPIARGSHLLPQVKRGSYSLAAEIGAYIHFGDKTCPSLVIAHSGGIEYQYGMVVPGKFRRLGLAYHPPLEEWAYGMYNLREYTGLSVWRQRDPDARLDETVTSTRLLLNQYRSIVERNGKTIFLFGAQKIGPTHPLFQFWTKETRDEFMSKLHATIDRIGTNYIWFDNDPEVTLSDSMHSDPKSAEHMAQVYADWIEAHRASLHTELASACPWPE